jgi:glycosyltransferase involved in cell wall biosynthesis
MRNQQTPRDGEVDAGLACQAELDTGLDDKMTLQIGLSCLSVYPGTNAGTTTYIAGLLRGLESQVGVRLTLIANREIAARISSETEQEVLTSVGYTRMERSVGRVPALAASALLPGFGPGGLDVVHYAQSVPAPRAGGAKVVTLHDVQHLDMPQLWSRRIRAWRKITYDEPARRADVVVTVSEHARDRIVQQLGVQPDKVVVAYHGVDHRIFDAHPRADDDRITEGLGAVPPFWFYPSSLLPHKNHRTLFEALVDRPGELLILTGPPSGREEELMDMISRYKLTDRVRYLGMVSSEQLAALYRRADGLVFPSLYEGFGAPLIEAMVSECPVACSKTGAVSEIAGDGAEFFDPRDPISIGTALDRLKDIAARKDLIQRGLRRAESFSWEKSGEQHVLAYRKAVEAT